MTAHLFFVRFLKALAVMIVALGSIAHAINIDTSGSFTPGYSGQNIANFLMSPTAGFGDTGADVSLKIKKDKLGALNLQVVNKAIKAIPGYEVQIDAQCDLFESTEQLGILSASLAGATQLGVRRGVFEAVTNRVIRANCVNKTTKAVFSIYINQSKQNSFAIIGAEEDKTYGLILF